MRCDVMLVLLVAGKFSCRTEDFRALLENLIPILPVSSRLKGRSDTPRN